MTKKMVKITETKKYDENPFIDKSIFKIDKGKKQIIAGSTKKVLVDTETGETEGFTVLHKFKEVDKDKFVKLFISEIKSLFGLSKTGLKVFGYVLEAMRINKDSIYLNPHKMMKELNYKSTRQIYRGLSELLANNIIAMSTDSNIWFINPSIIFNGDRIAFVKEYKLAEKSKEADQLEIEFKNSELNNRNDAN